MNDTERILAAIVANPGITRWKLHDLLRMPLDDVAAAVRELVEAGSIELVTD